MQGIADRLVETDRLRSCVKKHRCHATRYGVSFGVGHEGAAASRPSLGFLSHNVIYMQMSTAHQCVNRAHTQDAYQSPIPKPPDELVTAVALPSSMRKNCLFAQVRPQLHDDSESG